VRQTFWKQSAKCLLTNDLPIAGSTRHQLVKCQPGKCVLTERCGAFFVDFEGQSEVGKSLAEHPSVNFIKLFFTIAEEEEIS
jgi:hypothetical protein